MDARFARDYDESPQLGVSVRQQRGLVYRTLPLVILALATGCSMRPAVRGDVERGVSATELSLHLSATANAQTAPVVEQIQVSTRGVGRSRGTQGHIEWALARQSGARPLELPAVIRYGVVPQGFGSSGPAPALVSGQYELRVMSSGVWSVVPFRVTNQNTIE